MLVKTVRERGGGGGWVVLMKVLYRWRRCARRTQMGGGWVVLVRVPG